MRMIKIKKIILTITMAGFLFSMFTPKIARADMWGQNLAATLMKQVLEEAFLVLRNTILQTLKQEASSMIKGTIEKSVAGSVVSDYEDFIFGAAQVAAGDMLDDFFAVLQEGVSTSERDMLRNIEQTISKQISPEKPKVTLNEVVNSSDPIGDVFNQTVGGGVGALMEYQFGEYNNSTNAYVNTKERIEIRANQIAQAQQTEVLAGSGFSTTTDGGKVIPGKISQEIIAAAEIMPIEMINNASSLEEVIASFAVSAVNSFVKSGISVVSKPINNEIRKISRNVGKNGIEELQAQIKKGDN